MILKINFRYLCYHSLVLLAISISSIKLTRANSDPTVTIKWGKIKGTINQAENKDIAVFRGIPYAKPPVGELRFQKPRPVEGKYDGGEVFDATKVPVSCHTTQLGLTKGLKGFDVVEGEDCLTLDIWTPADTLKSDSLKPVLIFIHGGAFLVDGTRMGDHTGLYLSARGDIVTVIIRYRLGVMGCLFNDQEDMPGNLPLEDQALSIEWIRDNIKYFGGDPESITLSGLSAGSISTAIHYLQPGANSLFKQVILQSGAVTTELEESVEQSLERTKIIATKLGCWVNDQVNKECLRKLDFKSLHDAYVKSSSLMGVKTALPLCLVSKGSLSQSGADKLLISGQIPQNIPVLITSMEDEGSIIMGMFNMDQKKTLRDVTADLTGVLAPSIKENEIKDIQSTYFDGITGNEKFENMKAFVRMLGDRYFRCPSIWFAEKVAEHNTVYTAQFTRIGDEIAKRKPKFLFDTTFGQKHAADAAYVFGAPLANRNEAKKEDIEGAEFVIGFWTKFVRSGKVSWAPYKKTSHGDLFPFQLNIKIGDLPKATDLDPRYPFCQLWKRVYYKGKF